MSRLETFGMTLVCHPYTGTGLGLHKLLWWRGYCWPKFNICCTELPIRRVSGRI